MAARVNQVTLRAWRQADGTWKGYGSVEQGSAENKTWIDGGSWDEVLQTLMVKLGLKKPRKKRSDAEVE